MSRIVRILLPAALLLAIAVGGLILTRTPLDHASLPAQVDGRTTAAGPGTDSAALPAEGGLDEGRPENLGIPQGPYDPVLTQGVPAGRSLPPTNRRCNDPAGENVSIVQSEVTIAVQGEHVVAGWNDGQGFVDPNATVSGYGYSTDRGETWVDMGSVPNGQGTSVFGDPTVAVTDQGDWVFVSLDLGSPSGLAINRGRFLNGVFQLNPAVKFTDLNGSLDKEFVEYDSQTGRIYLTYINFGNGSGRLTYSSDAGATWASPVSVASGGNGYYPAPGIDGEVYVSWLNPLGQNNARVYVRHSPNGGQTWSGSPVSVKQLGNQSATPPQCFNRGFNILFPSMSVDRTNGPHRGRAYFCFTDGVPGGFDTYLTYSDDKGVTWATPVEISDEGNTSEQFWPQVHVGPDGRVTVGWYDRRNATNNNSLCDFYITQSVDGGVTFGPNRRLSDISAAWCGVPANIAPNFGDYIELTSDDRSVFGIWSDARGGGPDVYIGRFDDRHLLAVTGNLGENRTQFSANGTAWFIPNEAEFVASPAPQLDALPQLLVAGLGQGLLATPPETPGVFQMAAEAISGEVSLSSSQGRIDGTFAISRTGEGSLSYEFTATSSPELGQIVFLPAGRIQATLVPAGPGAVNIFGTATMSRLIGTLTFSLGGTLHLDGAPGQTLPANQSIDLTLGATTSPDLTVHTRTVVVDGVTVDVEPLVAGANPPPLATIRATPNPIDATTRVVFTLTHAAQGTVRVYSVDGRVVRNLAAGRFEPGQHDIPFDGKDDAGRRLPAGGYFLRLDTDMVRAAAKLRVVR